MTSPTVSALQLVTLTQVEPPGGLSVPFHLVGDDELSGGMGGWTTVPRPRRRALTEWDGLAPFTLKLPLLTDGLMEAGTPNLSVEAKCALLEQMGWKVIGGTQPPVLTVAGPVRQPQAGMRWVIQDLQWGAQVRRSDAQRIQQFVTVELLQYVTGDLLLGPAASARARQGL